VVKAAKKEGHRQRHYDPARGRGRTTASSMKDFTAKYGIHHQRRNPNGSSAQEITAIPTGQGSRATRGRASTSARAYATENMGLWAPYKVATWESDSRGLEGPRTDVGR